jgi:O-succinylbenzoic acid--CoA ligase
MLSHDAMRASAHAWADRLRPVNGAHWLACLPLYHVAGLAIVVRATRWGSLLEVMSRFDADAVDAAIDRGVTHTSLVPTQLEALLDARGSRAVPPTLRAVLIGGGPAPSALLTRARVGGWPVITTYGMTETGSGVAAGAVASGPEAGGLEPDRDSGLLRTLSGVSLRIEPDGESDGGGEILVAGEMLYSGYLGEPEATAERLRDGWFHTGDIGRLEADGRFRVLDRRDDLIISGGENISPAEVEAVLASYPGIRETAVVGLPDPRWGAVPVAAVVATIEVLDESALARHCRARLAPYKVPTRFVMVERLPRNELGKLLRRAVRERLAHAVDEAERARPTRETGP